MKRWFHLENPEADMETVLVTGVTGRVGANLARTLRNRGYRVRGLVMPGDAFERKLTAIDVDVVYGSLADEASLALALQDVDAVVHLAAQMLVGSGPPTQLFDVNVMGTARLLDASVSAPTPPRRFVLASTDSTYGPVAPVYQPIDEAHPQNAGDYYAISKVVAERLVENYGKQYDLPWTILRYGSVVTPDEVLQLFRYNDAKRLLDTAKAGKRHHLWQLFDGVDKPWTILDAAVSEHDRNPAVALTDADGNPWAIHYTDVRDTVNGTVAALEHPDAANETFNIMGPSTSDYRSGAKLMAERFDLPLYEVALPRRLAFEVSTEKATRLLGFTGEWSMDRMVAYAVRWSRNDDGDPAGVIPAAPDTQRTAVAGATTS